MAVNKRIRSKSSTQLRPNPQFKSELFDTLSHLNRGYGVALAAFDKLQHKHRLETNGRRQLRKGSPLFPARCLHDYRDRTEALRASANRDLLRLIAGHEDQDATRFATLLTAKAAKNAKS
jgi:hypothetical protein